MQEIQIYWLIRYLIFGISSFGAILVVAVVIIQKLYKYLSCFISLLIHLAYLIIVSNAFLYTDRFSTQGGSQIGPQNVLTNDNPWRILCKVQAYFIHASWMTSYILSVFMVFCIHEILKNRAKFIQDNKNKIIGISIIFPFALMVIPAALEDYGFGPNGFEVYVNGTFSQRYFFCGWKSSSIYTNDNQKRIRNELSYILTYLLPLILLSIINAILYIKIKLTKKEFDQKEIQLRQEELYLVRLSFMPFMIMFILTTNLVIRTGGFDRFKVDWFQFIILTLNILYDLIPSITSIVFLRFIYFTIPLSRLTFLSKKAKQEKKSILTQKLEEEQYD